MPWTPLKLLPRLRQEFAHDSRWRRKRAGRRAAPISESKRMSYDDYADADRDAWLEELYQENAEQAMAEFKEERLRSYYLANPLAVSPAATVLNEAKHFRGVSANACLVLATTAAEAGIKAGLLRPVVYGLIHTELFAGPVTDMVLGHAGFDRFTRLLFEILREFGGVDLNTFRRSGSTRLLWDELQANQKVRNAFVHRAQAVDEKDSDLALAVAVATLEQLVPSVVSRLGLHFHEEARVCGEMHLDPKIAEMLSRNNEKE